MTNRYEKQKIAQGFAQVIGCDEVGRGCLAGPVVAAAVVLPTVERFKNVRDSKLLSPSQREELDIIIRSQALAVGVGVVGQRMVDKMNIHYASLLAMNKAIVNLLSAVSFETPKIFVTVDGKFTIPNLELQQEAVIDGDNKILSIAAASIVAKVYRDELMTELHKKHPKYGFKDHKGYATFHHRQALKEFGLTPLHRISFCGKYM